MGQHSDSYHLPPPAGPAGENLYWSSQAGSTPTQVVQSWYSEVNNCIGGPEGFTDGCMVAQTGMTGHFTALIWKGVQSVGCAWSNNGNLAICRYKAGDSLSSATPNMGPESNYVEQVQHRANFRSPVQWRSRSGEPIGRALH